MSYIQVQKLLYGAKYLKTKRSVFERLLPLLYHSSEVPHEEILPLEWYKKAFPKITQLTDSLRNVDLINGRLVNINDNSTIIDDLMEENMHTFKSLVRVFLGSPSVQQRLKEKIVAFPVGRKNGTSVCFSKQNEREPIRVNSLTKVCNFLNISAQQRNSVRLTICPQITQNQVWIGALEEILNGLKSEMESFKYQCPSKKTQMGQQIVSSCLTFLADSATSYDPDSTSWMRLMPTKVVNSPTSHNWGDLLEMFNDLINCLKSEKWLFLHVAKLEIMKEGLFQIKDVLVDRSVGYKDARYQENLVRKKLSKTLGHSSKCLFTLLLYYLYGCVRDIDVDLCGGIYGSDDNRFCLCMGKILTSDEEKIVQSGVKQLDTALELFKFVWETAGMKGVLELQGHLWSVRAEGRTLTYRGKVFYVHGMSL